MGSCGLLNSASFFLRGGGAGRGGNVRYVLLQVFLPPHHFLRWLSVHKSLLLLLLPLLASDGGGGAAVVLQEALGGGDGGGGGGGGGGGLTGNDHKGQRASHLQRGGRMMSEHQQVK